jgi:uncharacterized membrane protein
MEIFEVQTLFLWLSSLPDPIIHNILIGCLTCNPDLQQEIYNSSFFPNLLKMLSAFFVLTGIVISLTYYSNKKCKLALNTYSSSDMLSPVPLTTASMVLGIGLGGFFDGIVFHQIFQWHAMISNILPPSTLMSKSVNMFWDGIFHFFTLSVVIVGVVLFWKLLRRKNIDTSGKLFGGGLLLGWGLFNIVEGVINHQILKLHNVMEFSTNHDIGNFIFLGVSLLMLGIGYMIIQGRNEK